VTFLDKAQVWEVTGAIEDSTLIVSEGWRDPYLFVSSIALNREHTYFTVWMRYFLIEAQALSPT